MNPEDAALLVAGLAGLVSFYLAARLVQWGWYSTNDPDLATEENAEKADNRLFWMLLLAAIAVALIIIF